MASPDESTADTVTGLALPSCFTLVPAIVTTAVSLFIVNVAVLDPLYLESDMVAVAV